MLHFISILRTHVCRSVFVVRPTDQTSVAQGLVYGESRRRAVAQTRLASTKKCLRPCRARYSPQRIGTETFKQKIFLVALLRSSSSKVQVPKFDYVACSSVRLSNHTRRKAIHNVSAHQLARYYLSQRVPSTAWCSSVLWYTRRKVERTTKILPNFWLTLVCILVCFKRIFLLQKF